MNPRQSFFLHVAQTSPAPLAIEIAKTKGSMITATNGKVYLDLIAGISVCNVGHRHPRVIKAIKKQVDDYLHVLVYGEMIESPQVKYASLLAKHLPTSLNSIYFTNSGTEATEAAMKLAKRVTGRTEIVAFKQSYHGSTQGALSVMGDEYWRNAYRPLLPGVLHLDYNDPAGLAFITENTACVIAETVQAERGVFVPVGNWMKRLKSRCRKTGTLLILDEIQTGFGRTGTLWGFEQYGIVPDMVLLGKALGGGMPLGAMVTDKSLMDRFASNPVLGHITTFGGHPVCCAAGLAALKVLLKEKLINDVSRKSKLFVGLLKHPRIKKVRAAGLLIAVEFEDAGTCKTIVDRCLERGVLTDWFLFAPHCLRIAPPLNITDKQIKKACAVILETLG